MLLSRHDDPERAFSDLVWAGAVGNVAWSIATLAVTGPWVQRGPWDGREWEFVARLTALFLLVWYLLSEWLLLIDPARSGATRTPRYWLGDLLLVLAIVVLAIALATPESPTWLMYSALSVGLSIAAVWHISDGWPESRVSVWVTKGTLNLGALVTLWSWYLTQPHWAPWHLVGVVFGVLAIWRILDLDKGRTPPQRP